MGWETLQAALLWRYEDEDALNRQLDALRSEPWLSDLGATDGDEVTWGYVQLPDRCLLSAAGTAQAKAFSRDKALLFFFTTDDFICEAQSLKSDFSGWGFRIFEAGEERARVEFDYAWPSYGDELKSALQQALGSLDSTLFERFELGAEREAALQALLDPVRLYARLEDIDTLEDIERAFCRVLDIEFDFLGNA